MKRAVVMDLCTLLRAPVYRPLMLVYLTHRAGGEVVVRSYLGRGTTKKLLRLTHMLGLVDDFIWNDGPTPEHAYELTGPDDDILALASRELTARLNYAE
jgi:hypothetical protein